MSKIITRTIRGNSGFGSSFPFDVIGQVVGFRITNTSLSLGTPSGVTLTFGSLDALGAPIQVLDATMQPYSITADARGGISASGSGVGSGAFWIDVEVTIVE